MRKYANSIVFLIEPFYHGVQYIDVLEKKECEYIILRRAEAPKLNINHETYTVDFDRIDDIVKLIKNRTTDRKYEHVGIIPGNDFCVQFAFAIAQKLGIPSNTEEAGLGARNKILMRQKLLEKKVKAPRSKTFYSLQEIKDNKSQFAYPLVIKPPDMSSSLYVELVNNYEELITSAENIFAVDTNLMDYPVIKAVLVEEYAKGPEFSVELLLNDSEVLFSSVTEKHKGALPHFVEIGHVVPSTVTTDEQNGELVDAAVRAAKAIGIKYGPAHVEVVYTKDGPSIIELAARIGGDNIMKLVREATGVYLPEYVVDVALGIPVEIPPIKNNGATIKFITAKPGEVKEISGFDKIKSNINVVESELEVEIGDIVKQLESSEDRIGYIIVKGTSAVDAIKNAESVISELEIKTV